MDQQQLAERLDLLRPELKQWEKRFAAANEGRTATKEDIKKDPAIASKYKEYNSLRDLLTRRPTGASPTEPSRKRKAFNQPTHTPSKTRAVSVKTPSHQQGAGTIFAEESSAAKDNVPTPSLVRLAVGPTPQRDGKVLGLFDLLSSHGSEATPSKGTRAVLGAVSLNAQATPSKSAAHQGGGQENDNVVGKVRECRTPASSGKVYFLSTFATPLARRRDDGEMQLGATPSSVSRGLFTPAFLRRDRQRLETVREEPLSPIALPPRWKRQGPGRSLSRMIAGLRDMEEDRLDEEMDILRELEDGGAAADARSKTSSKVLVEDSQYLHLPVPEAQEDVDGESGNEKLPPDALDANGNPRKVWKKKGLKRQTRRVNMRPVRAKPQPPPNHALKVEDEEDCSEPQRLVAQNPANSDSTHELAEQEQDENSSDGETSPAPKKGRADVKGNVVTKAVRKISSQAHANFRALKIKNKNSKGKGKGRFSKGRR